MPSDDEWDKYYSDIDKLNTEAWEHYKTNQIIKFSSMSDKEKLDILISDYIVRNRPSYIR